ncbi:hypothetical protein PAXRUDRAFT_33114 [Paxillus rubicundulus Ve08.2h10]|uniref:Uncharacterized protein n=1 Tax=Paxillus rubicundulus Ve08.2h10 TaxID=930991 RepID=A0A0D0E8S5_9AGAM|nr:hypothetical protein PAXRUDRAFT_33114 [Paxillus rubicundulus Ve08.2h10]
MDFGLEDVHVLVTGASGGIGLEAAKLYCAIGAKVTAHYNAQFGPLEKLSQTYPNLRIVQSDLSNKASVVNVLGTSDNLVQVLVDVPLADMTLQRWNHAISTSLTSSFLVCREYLKHLKNATPEAKETAVILLIGGAAGKHGEAGHADYAATKSAMMYGLMMTLENKIIGIAPKGRVNTVAPGWVKIPMAEIPLSNPRILYSALATTPLKKIAMPLDIANQIVGLSSLMVSGHVTGQVLMVDGGMEGSLSNKPEDI